MLPLAGILYPVFKTQIKCWLLYKITPASFLYYRAVCLIFLWCSVYCFHIYLSQKNMIFLKTRNASYFSLNA